VEQLINHVKKCKMQFNCNWQWNEDKTWHATAVEEWISVQNVVCWFRRMPRCFGVHSGSWRKLSRMSNTNTCNHQLFVFVSQCLFI